MERHTEMHILFIIHLCCVQMLYWLNSTLTSFLLRTFYFWMYNLINIMIRSLELWLLIFHFAGDCLVSVQFHSILFLILIKNYVKPRLPFLSFILLLLIDDTRSPTQISLCYGECIVKLSDSMGCRRDKVDF